MKKKPIISIVTIVLNDFQNIERTLLSVIYQSIYDKIEYIVIDGGSTDGTLDIIGKYTETLDLFVSEKDNGIYDAMNKGLAFANGEYILFLNSGDSLSGKQVIEHIFSEKTHADVYFGETNLVDGTGEVMGTRSQLTTRKLPDHLTAKSFLKGMLVSHQSFIPKKSLTLPFETKYRCSADIDWCIKVLKKSASIYNTGTIISNFLVGGLSNQRKEKCIMERFKILKNHFGLVSAIFSQVYIIFRYVKFLILKGKTY